MAFLEDQLLLACSRRELSIATTERVRGYLKQEIDWKYILARAQQHAVLPLLNQNLKLYFSNIVPQSVLSSLNELSRYCQQRSLALTGELLRILALFEKQKIEAIPFKGPALATAAYGNLSLRMFADLDILIREEDLAYARETMVADGYVVEFVFTPQQERDYQKTECALQLSHPGRNSTVELHWLLTERYVSIKLPIDALWQRCTVAKIGSKTVKALSPEDLLLYLCIHGSKHQWERLEWLCSIAEIVEAHPSMNWAAINDRAGVSGTRRILKVALLLSKRLLGTHLPNALRADAENDSIALQLSEQAAAMLFLREPKTVEQRGKGGDWYLYLLRTRERWRDKFRILAYSAVRLPHPSAHEFVRLPSKLAFLYYILRPARLFGATVGSALRDVGGRKISKESKLEVHSGSPVL